jgi:hypothetical protein
MRTYIVECFHRINIPTASLERISDAWSTVELLGQLRQVFLGRLPLAFSHGATIAVYLFIQRIGIAVHTFRKIYSLDANAHMGRLALKKWGQSLVLCGFSVAGIDRGIPFTIS